MAVKIRKNNHYPCFDINVFTLSGDFDSYLSFHFQIGNTTFANRNNSRLNQIEC